MARRWPQRGTFRPKQVAVKLKLPFLGEISGTWEPGVAESEAAWELYVELITRVSVVDLGPDEGLVREALSSLYTLFNTTREILREHGPAVAPRSRQHDVTFGHVAIGVLNGALRPLLTKWHPALQTWEAQRGPHVDPYSHERAWDRFAELHAQLVTTRRTLAELAAVLADVAGAAYLLPDVPSSVRSEETPGGGCAESRRYLTPVLVSAPVAA